MVSITWREYLKREATDVFNVLLVVLVALTIWVVLWFSPTLIDHITQRYHASIACIEDAPKTLGDVIRSRAGVVAHPACYTIWREESMAQKRKAN